ncbi:anoctamin-9-like [Heptranchias perlo]|uniref:anoctamin-9-like n=1 Tax=Heptranchias perlo TaxID=212740 RepID=UPI003559F397
MTFLILYYYRRSRPSCLPSASEGISTNGGARFPRCRAGPDKMQQAAPSNRQLPPRACARKSRQLEEERARAGDNDETIYIVTNAEDLLSEDNGYLLGGTVLAWFRTYLSGRSQRITCDGFSFRFCTVTSGVPQGSILGPILILINLLPLGDKHQRSCEDLFEELSEVFTFQALQESTSDLLHETLKTHSSVCTALSVAMKAKVDFVLVSRKPNMGIDKNEANRRFYLKKLRDIGFNIMKKEDDNNYFFGIQAPDKMFEKYIQLLDIAERTCSTTGIDTISKSTRIRIINFILWRTSSPGSDHGDGLRELLNNNTFHSAFPLHEECIWEKEHKFQHGWADWKCLFKNQPINQIRQYFGERLALYFAWLGWYTTMLIPASICGLFVFLYGLVEFGNNEVSKEICNANTTIMCPLCDQRCPFWKLSDTCTYAKITQLFDHGITILFAMFMGIWATVFLELWKRARIKVVSEWDLFHWDEDEEELALGLIYNPDVAPVEYQHSYVRSTIVLLLECVLITIIMSIALGIVVFRIVMAVILTKASVDVVRDNASSLAVIIGALLHFFTIIIMTKINYLAAKKLCSLEKQRTVLARENSFTVKMFTFQFFTMFASIIYIAFFLGRFNGHPGDYVRVANRWRLEECHPSGCMTDLLIQMSVVMVLKQLLSTSLEYAIPSLKHKWNNYQKRFSEDNMEHTTKHWIKNYNLNDFNSYSLFNEFLEMAIQYGFTTIFVAAFPLAPLLALLNNLCEIRLDAKKMILLLKRPIPRKAKDIGIWLQILEIIGVLAIIGNGLVISLTSDFVPRQVYSYSYGQCVGQHGAKINCLTGYVNSSLSVFHLKNFQNRIVPKDDGSVLLGLPVTHCRYRDYRNDYDYEYTVQFWHILAARLAFLLLFENIAICIKYFASWFIPDVPVSVRNENLSKTYDRLKEELK